MAPLRSRIVRHFETQQRLGVPPWRAAIGLPQAIRAYRARQAIEGHQIDGYGRFDVPLLASYSRSGTNWIRYVVEWVAQAPTPGQVRLYSGTDFVIDRAHRAFTHMHEYEAVVLVVRDYRECLLRHHRDLWDRTRDVRTFLLTEDVPQPPSWYWQNIAAFDSFEGRRLVLHYEDILQSPEESLPRLTDFLGLDGRRTRMLLDDVDGHSAQSVRSYTMKGHDSVTSGSGRMDHHASAMLEDGQAEEFDRFFAEEHPALFERYLARYAIG